MISSTRFPALAEISFRDIFSNNLFSEVGLTCEDDIVVECLFNKLNNSPIIQRAINFGDSLLSLIHFSK